MITTLERPVDTLNTQALVGAPNTAPFTLKRVKSLSAPQPLLREKADLSPVGNTLLDWYWHGTPASNLPSIYEHGLLPEKTKNYRRTCMAARSHVAFFWGKLSIAIDGRAEPVALIRIPGWALREADLGVEKGSLQDGAYGNKMPDIAKASRQTWPHASWGAFQATFGCISTAQPLTITPEMVVVCPMLASDIGMQAAIQEWSAGKPIIA